jgi:tetratricopeptide (TPR) repeat protein
VRAAFLGSPERQLRLAAERQALARLTHPHIAQLYDAGTTAEGTPYFAMEVVHGDRITDGCDERALPLPDRLRLFVAVCEGVLHAHQKGVIHRDLKPSNILVTASSGRLIPKIIDFGIAKALDEPLVGVDLTAGPVGTPGYVSPEGLAALAGPAGLAEADTRTDVYSLGVLLCELLAGVRPFPPLAPAELLLAMRDRDPPRPSARFRELAPEGAAEIARRRGLSPRALLAALRSDLDWIVLRAIARDRDQRYPSVAALAADVERYLEARPLEAGPPSFWYRAGKTIRRHRGSFAAAVLLLLSLAGGLVARSLEAARANRAAAEAERARQAAEAARAETERVASFLASLFTAAAPEQTRGREVTARELLDRGAERIGQDLDEAPRVRARLLHTIAGVYQRLGLYREALPLAEQALELRTAELGEGDLAVAESLRLLAILHVELGDRDRAGELFRHVLELREAALGPEHPDVGDSLGNLGYFLMQQRRFDEARPLLERALDIRTKTLGGDHPRLSPTLYNLALLHQTVGRFDLAEPLYRRALDIDTRAYGEDHPAVAQGIFGLGDLYLAMGRHDEAARHLGQALERSRALFGADAIQTAYIHDSLGELARERQDLETAERELGRALALFDLQLAADHPDRQTVAKKLDEVRALRAREAAPPR